MAFIWLNKVGSLLEKLMVSVILHWTRARELVYMLDSTEKKMLSFGLTVLTSHIVLSCCRSETRQLLPVF